MYVAVKGGEKAILASYRMLDTFRRGDTAVPELSLAQIREQMPLAVAKVMAEGSLYDPHLASLAIKQAAGDLIEAVFLLRAYRTTLPRFAYSAPIDTDKMNLMRRISSTFKDLPGGQVLGPTYDYTQRLLDFSLEAVRDPMDAEDEREAAEATPSYDTAASASAPAFASASASMPRVTDLLGQDELVEADLIPAHDPDPADVTRASLGLPADRATRLQNLARADEGFLLSMGYSTQRGYGNTHPFAAEIRYGDVEVEMFVEELGFAVVAGEIEVTECQMVSQFVGNGEQAPRFTRGYGLVFGYAERKAMSMALVDRALRARELGEAGDSPANDEEFVLYHSDNVEASGFTQHLKLPHHVDFQSNLALLRRLRAEYAEHAAKRAENSATAAALAAGHETEFATSSVAATPTTSALSGTNDQ